MSGMILWLLMACKGDVKWGEECRLPEHTGGKTLVTLQERRSSSCNDDRGLCVAWGVSPVTGTCWPRCKGVEGGCPDGMTEAMSWDEKCYCEPLTPPF